MRTRAPRTTQYRTLEHFYRGDARRRASEEVDVGLWWREEADAPLHRAAWVRDTGELYLVRLGAGDGLVEVLGIARERGELDAALQGWKERCGRPRSLSWLREHARRLPAALVPRPRRVVSFATAP